MGAQKPYRPPVPVPVSSGSMMVGLNRLTTLSANVVVSIQASDDGPGIMLWKPWSPATNSVSPPSVSSWLRR